MEFFEHVNPAMNSLHQSDHVDQAAETTGRVMHVVRHGQASHNVALAAGEIRKRNPGALQDLRIQRCWRVES